MAGKGRTPKDPEQRRNRSEPQRGEWVVTEGSGWQHGEIPEPPEGLMPESEEAWRDWFGAWFAANWIPEDIHMLRRLIRLFDKDVRNQATAADGTNLRYLSEAFGITPKAQQDRRWKRPEAPKGETPKKAASGDHYGHLRSV